MCEASYPDDLVYHVAHDWSRIDPGSLDCATLGVTWYAQEALGEVIFFEPPEIGARVVKDECYAELESVKAVSAILAPLSGEIVEINSALSDNPEMINRDPYGAGWLVRVRLSDVSERAALMDARAYRAMLT